MQRRAWPTLFTAWLLVSSLPCLVGCGDDAPVEPETRQLQQIYERMSDAIDAGDAAAVNRELRRRDRIFSKQVRKCFESAMNAVCVGDWTALAQVLTADARAKLGGELDLLVARANDPERGSQLRRWLRDEKHIRVAESGIHDRSDALRLVARMGGYVDVPWLSLIEFAPTWEPGGRARGATPTGMMATAQFEAPTGEERTAKFVESAGVWLLNELPL